MFNRPVWMSRRFYISNLIEEFITRVEDKIACMRGKHGFKMGSWPRCYKCGKVLS